MKKFLWIGLVALVLLFGCNILTRDFYRAADDFPENGKGMLVLILDGDDVATHTIAPPTGTMDILSYNISGGGDHSSSPTIDDDVDVADLTGGTVYSRNDLLPGTWTIQVTAYNADGGEAGLGARIGYGEIYNLFVSPNSLVTGTVPLAPDTGGTYTGLLSLEVRWIDSTVPNPVVVADLTAGTPGTTSVPNLEADFNTPTSTNVTLVDRSLIAGYYTLFIELYTGSVAPANKIMGDNVSVRIVSTQTSSGLWDLSNTSGEADITISPDLNNPIEITLTTTSWPSQAQADLVDPPALSYFAYEWYEDGELKQGPTDPLTQLTNDSYNSATTFISGSNHNLTVVVTEYLGSTTASEIATISSETHPFTAP